tara:strand:+ start:97 stop:567 length:471 start_codon:yes stop_codon:yes gene_type:complete
MNDAPERIWAWQETDPITDKKWGAGQWYTDDVVLDGDEVEYIRKDLAKPRVKPLVWHVDPQYETDEFGCDSWGEFSSESIVATCKTKYLAVYQHSEDKYMWVDGTLDNIRYSKYKKPPKWETVEIPWYPTVDQAKAAAQADYEQRILSALEDTWTP